MESGAEVATCTNRRKENRMSWYSDGENVSLSYLRMTGDDPWYDPDLDEAEEDEEGEQDDN